MSDKISTLRNDKQLFELFNRFLSHQDSIDIVNVCTTDGFNVGHASRPDFDCNVEQDKLAALASTFCSLGQSAAQNIIKQKMLVSSIETTKGHLLFVKVLFLDHPCVLTVASGSAISLGEARYKAIKLAREIINIKQA